MSESLLVADSDGESPVVGSDDVDRTVGGAGQLEIGPLALVATLDNTNIGGETWTENNLQFPNPECL